MSFKTVIFDLDGVLYRGNTAIPGALETIEKLQESRKNIYFLTNAGTMSRAGRASKLKTLGFNIEQDQVYTSSYAVGHYIAKEKQHPTAYIVGEGGLKEELASFGVFQTDKKPDFVVVSLDREITYARLKTAFRCILNGSKFIATNHDATFPVENGLNPGAGSIVASVEYATKIKPVILGKPNTYLLDLIIKESSSSKEEILFVGDRLDSDIELAKRAGIKSALVLTGVSSKEDVEKLEEKDKPDYLAGSVKDLLEVML